MILLSQIKIKERQRYKCLDCGSTFSIRKSPLHHYSQSFIFNTVKNYVSESVTLRALASRIKASKSSILNWLNQLGEKTLTPLEVYQVLKPTWGDILLIDAKFTGSFVVMIAVDHHTGDPFHYHLCLKEDKENFRTFLTTIKDKFNYQPKAIVSDQGRGNSLVELIREIFPEAIHQLCTIHFSRFVKMTVPKNKKGKFFITNKMFYDDLSKIFNAQDKKEADNSFKELLSKKDIYNQKYHKTILKSLTLTYDLFTHYLLYPFIPKDTNKMENVNRQLERRLKVTDNFKSFEILNNFLRLWFIWFRFQPLKNPINKNNNNKSRLNLAKVETNNINWLKFALNRHT